MMATQSTCRFLTRQRRHSACSLRRLSVYGFGCAWTGALSRSAWQDDEQTRERSAQELAQFGELQAMAPLEGVDWRTDECVAGAAGWGHTALVVRRRTDGPPRLMVCGRPHDFQTLLRVKRLPKLLRDVCLSHTWQPHSQKSVWQRLASHFVGDNQLTACEDDHRRYCNVSTLIELPLPNQQSPAIQSQRIQQSDKEADQQTSPTFFHTHFQNTLAASAGLTAVISTNGTLYTFGLNHRGQCGVGAFSPNVWTPTPVVGLASNTFLLNHHVDLAEDNSHPFQNFKDQEYPIVSVALGLQHGIALDAQGQVFSWGKGERGQLGLGQRFAHEQYTAAPIPTEIVEEKELLKNRTLEHALQVSNFYDPYATMSSSLLEGDIYAPLLSHNDSRIRLISAGMNFSIAITDSNLPYIWGKNCVPNPSYDPSAINLRSKPVRDSTYPRFIPGLPPHLPIIKVACGTHHSAMLLEDGSVWAVGVATDRPLPIWEKAVQIVPPDVVDVATIVSFTAGFDRTIIVYGAEDRKQVIEIQLWSQEDMRWNGSVRPSWVDWLEDQTVEQNQSSSVQSVHRGWMHTIVITK